MSSRKSVCIKVVGMTALCVTIGACSKEPTNIPPTPLSEITGERIYFEVCSKRLSVERSRILAIRSMQGQGLPAKNDNTGITFEVDPVGIGGSDRRNEYIVYAISCPLTPYPTRYRSVRASDVVIKELADIGLEETAGNKQQLHSDVEYRPLDPKDQESGFLIRCSKQAEPMGLTRCIFEGQPIPGVSAWMNVHVGSSLKNWREFKHFFESFLRVEERQ